MISSVPLVHDRQRSVSDQMPLEGARVRLPGGRVFSLAAYQASREDMTTEFEEIMNMRYEIGKQVVLKRRITGTVNGVQG